MNTCCDPTSINTFPRFSKIVVNNIEYIQFEHFSVQSSCLKDQNCVLKDGTIVVINHITMSNDQCYVYGNYFLTKKNLYTIPYLSSEN